MYSYTAYGLGIESELELPLLLPGATRIDVHIRLGNVGEYLPPNTLQNADVFVQVLAPQLYLSRQEDASYLVRNGNEIIVEPHAEGETRRIQVRLCTFGFGMLLQQRGYLVLHGNALAKGNRVIAVMGDVGAGKSTLTMQLVQAGYTFIADDVLAFEIEQDGTARVLPGVPLLKLWPDALAQLGIPEKDAPLFWKGFDKRLWALPVEQSESSFVLSQIYLLGEASEISSVPLELKTASLQLLSNRYVLARLDAGTPDRTFDQCVAIAKRVRICLLRRPKDFGKMNVVIRQIETDLAGFETGSAVQPKPGLNE